MLYNIVIKDIEKFRIVSIFETQDCLNLGSKVILNEDHELVFGKLGEVFQVLKLVEPAMVMSPNFLSVTQGTILVCQTC